MSKPILWIVIPCYNEEQVLPITAPMFLQKITSLTEKGMIIDNSRVLFPRQDLGAHLQLCKAGCAFHRHFPEPEPGPSERRAGGPDGGPRQ